MRGKFVLDHLAVPHHEPNLLQFGDVGDRVSWQRHEISKFPRPNNHTLLVT
jgi:hypothetical protein